MAKQVAWFRPHGGGRMATCSRGKKQKHKEPHGDVSHGDEPHGDESRGDVNHPWRNKSRGSGRMAAVAWRRVPAEGALV